MTTRAKKIADDAVRSAGRGPKAAPAGANAEPGTRRYKELGPLHDLLLKACPGPAKSIPKLAEALGVTHQYVYRWIETKRVPPKYVTKMVDFAGSQVSFKDFHSYVF